MHVQSVSYNLFSRRQLTVVPLTGPGAGLLLPVLAASHHPHPLLHCGEFRWTRRTILPVTLCCDWPAAACAGLWLAEALLGIRCQALGDHGWPSQEGGAVKVLSEKLRILKSKYQTVISLYLSWFTDNKRNSFSTLVQSAASQDNIGERL